MRMLARMLTTGPRVFEAGHRRMPMPSLIDILGQRLPRQAWKAARAVTPITKGASALKRVRWRIWALQSIGGWALYEETGARILPRCAGDGHLRGDPKTAFSGGMDLWHAR